MNWWLDSKVIGGILLIIGTSIGAGMLALPLSNSPAGYIDSSLFLVICWLAMTLGALLILEVNLWLPAGSNLVSMAQATLGRGGQVITWLAYLFLFYALLSAYISGGADVLMNLTSGMGIQLPTLAATLLFVATLGTIVFRGIGAVDIMNRGLMFAKIGIYALLVFLISPHIQLPNLQGGQTRLISSAIMVLITSYGFAIIVPSLRTYFNDDVAKLRKVIIFGSIIPLLCYLAWDAVIMGVIPREGQSGLMALNHASQPVSGLTAALQTSLNNNTITQFFRSFSSVCMLTAFLGVALAMRDFLADGLKLEKRGRQGFVLALLTFVPPLLIVTFYPSVFISALAYAGIPCLILLLLLPLLMAWRGRYSKQFKGDYQVPGGKSVLILGFIAVVGFLLAAFL